MNARNTSRSIRGFTLIEMIIVIALIGLMAAIAIPYFKKINERTQLRSDAFQIQSTLMAARMNAIRRNVGATVTLTVGAPTDSDHTLTTAFGTLPDPPPGTPTPVPLAPVLSIPKNHIDIVATPRGGVITFRGDGTLSAPPFPTPALIVVAGPPGAGSPNQITILTDPTGRVKVITPVAWN